MEKQMIFTKMGLDILLDSECQKMSNNVGKRLT